MKNGLLVSFIILSLGVNAYLYYKIERLNMMVSAVYKEVEGLEKVPATCTFAYPDGTTLTRPILQNGICPREN